MKILKFTIVCIIGLIHTSSQAHLFQGLSVKVFTFIDDAKDPPSVIIELCKGKPDSVASCKGNIQVVDCKKESYQWDCLTQESYPYRIGLKIGKKNLYSADAYYLAGNATQDRYSLHFESGRLNALKLPNELNLEIGMEEMLENVFHPSVVKKIREYDQKKDPIKNNGSWDYIDNPETRMILTTCQFEDCSRGKREEVSCKFATRGIRGFSYSCPVPSSARYMLFTLYGLDKIRKTKIFRFQDRKDGGYGLNHISLKSNSLEEGYDFN